MCVTLDRSFLGLSLQIFNDRGATAISSNVFLSFVFTKLILNCQIISSNCEFAYFQFFSNLTCNASFIRYFLVGHTLCLQLLLFGGVCSVGWLVLFLFLVFVCLFFFFGIIFLISLDWVHIFLEVCCQRWPLKCNKGHVP